MSSNSLYKLLPAVIRMRDRGETQALLDLLSEPIGAIDENLAQLYDDLFVETCADWVLPYIGDLIGYRTLHGTGSPTARRSEVAHTIAFRRRKGTASMLEQLARDVTGWSAHAVEFYQKLARTQYMNDVRLDRPGTANLRDWTARVYSTTAFDTCPHTVDVRRIAASRGKYNIPNVGLFLWPYEASPLTRTPAVAVDTERFVMHPLGISRPIVTFPQMERDIAHLAEPLNVPVPILRRALLENLPSYYGEGGGAGESLAVYLNGVLVPEKSIDVRHLGDNGATWGLRAPDPGRVAIDPQLGRIMLGTALQPRETLHVTFHYPALMQWGGGEYEREATFVAPQGARIENVSARGVAGAHPDVKAALAALAAGGQGGVVQILDSERYEIPAASALVIDVPAGKSVELRAANQHRPTLALERPIEVKGGADSRVSINGLLLSGKAGQVLMDGGSPVPGALVRVPSGGGNTLAELAITHCTLVPGRSLDATGASEHPDEPSVLVERDGMKVALTRTISGALRVAEATETTLIDCMIDAVTLERVAYDDPAGNGEAGGLSAESCTIKGKVRAERIDSLSNCICLSEVVAIRRQVGCVRFSYLPVTSRVPRRYRCQPNENGGAPLAPRFASLEFGTALYGWLTPATPAEILTGAEDEGEMGALHAVHRPQREANLRIRLAEYLRAGLEAGIFYETWGLDSHEW